jgi:hypothetical protein
MGLPHFNALLNDILPRFFLVIKLAVKIRIGPLVGIRKGIKIIGF